MDYIAMNLPVKEMTHVWSPTVGAYDKLAIRYGGVKMVNVERELLFMTGKSLEIRAFPQFFLFVAIYN